jgi:hypothetical protein
MSLVGKVAIVAHSFMVSHFQLAQITAETEKTARVRTWRNYRNGWEETDSRRSKDRLIVQIIGDVDTVDAVATAAALERIEQARRDGLAQVERDYLTAIKGLADGQG